MFSVLGEYLLPAIDDLLTWGPLSKLLSDDEVVTVDPSTTTSIEGKRACLIARPRVTDGIALLGASYLYLPSSGIGTISKMSMIAKRGERPSILWVITQYHQYPKTLQSDEALAQRYADIYLTACRW